jgi:hypothetical protein
MSAGGSWSRLARTVEDAIDRVESGYAVFLPATPSMSVDALVDEVRRAAETRSVAVALEIRRDGVRVSGDG